MTSTRLLRVSPVAVAPLAARESAVFDLLLSTGGGCGFIESVGEIADAVSYSKSTVHLAFRGIRLNDRLNCPLIWLPGLGYSLFGRHYGDVREYIKLRTRDRNSRDATIAATHRAALELGVSSSRWRKSLPPAYFS